MTTCGAFTPDGTFMLLSDDLSATPFGKIREDGIFRLLLTPASQGWVVYGPDSVRVPTVRDGEMLILYFLPGAAIEFLKA